MRLDQSDRLVSRSTARTSCHQDCACDEVEFEESPECPSGVPAYRLFRRGCPAGLLWRHQTSGAGETDAVARNPCPCYRCCGLSRTRMDSPHRALVRCFWRALLGCISLIGKYVPPVLHTPDQVIAGGVTLLVTTTFWMRSVYGRGRRYAQRPRQRSPN